MVGGGLWSLKTESSGSIGGFSPLKPALTDPTGGLQKIQQCKLFSTSFLSNYLRSNEIYARFREISTRFGRNLTKSSEISAGFGDFSPLKNDFDNFFHCGRPDHARPYSDANPTALIWLSRQSAAGLNFHHLILLGQLRVGHKPDPNRPVDNPIWSK